MNRFCLRVFRSRLLFILTVLLVSYGLFFVPGDEQTPRYLNAIWNLGHVASFLLLWTFAFHQFERLQRYSLFQLIIVVIVTSLLLGGLIEVLQGLIGRDSEWQDVWDSGVGGLLATAFCAAQSREVTPWLARSWRILVLVILVIVPWPIWRDLMDEIVIRQQSPILSNFSTPFEFSRWHANRARIHVKRLPDRSAALDVDFLPALYSTITLKYFYRDWHSYKNLVLDVRNPEMRSYPVVLRIHDRLHRLHHFALNDRFNRRLVLKPGRQKIVISLQDVEQAPQTRSMDMRHIQALSLFTMKSKVFHHLFINAIYLE